MCVVWCCRKPSDTSPRFQPYSSPRSHQEPAPYRSRSTSSVGYSYHAPAPPVEYRAGGWSSASHEHEGDSTSNPSPTSPATPSSLSENDERPPSQYSGGGVGRGKPFPGIAGRLGQQWGAAAAHDAHACAHGDRQLAGAEAVFPLHRGSYEGHSDGDSTHPHRPW